MENEETKKLVENLINNKLRYFLQRDGGDIEFVDYKNGIVYIKPLGACTDCIMADDTLGGIKDTIMEEVPGILDVVALEQNI